MGRFFARFDPFGHKKHDWHEEPKAEKTEASSKPKPLTHPYFPFPWWLKPATRTRAPLRANDTVAVVNATAMAGSNTTDAAATANTTTPIPTVNDAQLQGRGRRRHLLRGSEESDIDDATPMATAGDNPGQQQSALGQQRLARTEEVEMLRHQQLWALPREGAGEKAKATMVGEAYERTSSQSVIFLGGADDHKDADALPQRVETRAMSEADGQDEEGSAVTDDEHEHGERGRQLLLHHWHGGRASGLDDEYDDYDDDDYEEEELERQPSYYSKDGGDWYWQTHGGFRRALQEMGGGGMDMDGGDPAALLINADDPETAVGSRRRPTPAEVRDMTPEEQAALQERGREELENLLRKASREEEAHRPEPTVAKSLDSVLAALAVRPPLKAGAGNGDYGDVADLPGARRRALQGAAAAGGAGNAGAQRAAALVSAVAGSFTEQQKAQIRQVVYDAAVSMVREAARQAMQEAGYGNGGSGSTANGNGNNKARGGNNNNNVGRGGAFGNGGNEDAYEAAANAILNVLSRNDPGPPAVRAAVLDHAEERRGSAAAAASSRASESQGRTIDTGRGKSLLEAARAAARQSASAGRPPAGYDPYPPHRHERRRRLRGLKDATFRVPVPFTRDPASNATNPKLVYNASDAIFINLRAREDEDGALQITAESMRSDGAGKGEGPVPWPAIGGLGPALNGLDSNGGSGDNPKGKHAWADALLKLVHRHRHQPAYGQSHPSRLLDAAQQAPAAATTAPEAAAPATEPAKQSTTVGDYLRSAAGANNNMDGTAAAGGAGAGGNGGGGAGLDLNALSGLLQRPFVPPVPGSIGAVTNDMHQQPGTDAFGNQVEQPPTAEGQGQKQGQGAGTSMMGEQQAEEEEDDDETDAQQPVGLGDAFYGQAASQLLSHSGSNFKKMQAVVDQIMAEQGFDV